MLEKKDVLKYSFKFNKLPLRRVGIIENLTTKLSPKSKNPIRNKAYICDVDKNGTQLILHIIE